MTIPSPDNARQLHDTGQDALLELELATLEMNADEKWMLEQLLLTYVADSVPPETWAEGLAAGVRAVRLTGLVAPPSPSATRPSTRGSSPRTIMVLADGAVPTGTVTPGDDGTVVAAPASTD